MLVIIIMQMQTDSVTMMLLVPRCSAIKILHRPNLEVLVKFPHWNKFSMSNFSKLAFVWHCPHFTDVCHEARHCMYITMISMCVFWNMQTCFTLNWNSKFFCSSLEFGIAVLTNIGNLYSLTSLVYNTRLA